MAVFGQHQNGGHAGILMVAHKFRTDTGSGQLYEGIAGTGEFGYRSGLKPLGFHGRFKTGHIHSHAFIPDHVTDDIDRKSVGVIQFENHVAGHLGLPFGFHVVESIVQELEAVVQRFGEPALLVLNDIGDESNGVRKFGIGRFHEIADRSGRPVQKRPGQSDIAAVADGPAHDPAKHIAPAFVGRQHPVSDQKGRRPAVIGNDFHGHIAFVRFAKMPAAEGFGFFEDGHDEIGVVIGADILHHRHDPLQPHTRIDAGLGKGRHLSGFVAVELHEHEIPDFQIPVTFAPHLAFRLAASIALPPIDEDFRTGAAGAGVSHGPEIVFFAEPDNALCGNADVPVPEIVGFVIVQIHGCIEFVGRQTVAVGQEIPSEFDGFFLEIIPERKIAEHFKKRVVPGRIADIFQIVVLAASPDAFLGSHGTVIGPLFLSEKGALELNHARIGE